MTEALTERDPRIKEFEADLAAHNFAGHWQVARRERAGGAQHWKWADIYPLLMRAGELIGMDDTGRRTIKLITPGLDATTPTIQMSVQLVLPGEVAAAHRHAFAATRFIVQGAGAYTTVDGEALQLAAGDYVTTPSMAFHDHVNESAEPIIWLDIHDNPLLSNALKLSFRSEYYPTKAQPITQPAGRSRDLMGMVRPAGRTMHPAHQPAAYPQAEVRAALDRAAEGPSDPYDGTMLDYVNPVSAGHLLPTIGARIQLLRPREQTQPHRHSSYTIYHVVEGEGVSVVGDRRFEWTTGDCFTVPGWVWHSHAQQGERPAVLFSVHNQPVLEAFDLYQEEREES
jgi:gentisate 1,2-dioxygenase